MMDLGPTEALIERLRDQHTQLGAVLALIDRFRLLYDIGALAAKEFSRLVEEAATFAQLEHRPFGPRGPDGVDG